jgi:hypothetical protein
MNILVKEHKEMLLMLTKHEVEFMLIGGYAVIYYGYGRTTEDMDIWLKPDNDNKLKLLKALNEIGIIEAHLNELSKIDFTKVNVLSIGEKPYKIDFLTKIMGVEYIEAEKQKKMLPLSDKYVSVIHFKHLIINKLLSNRPQDKADVDILQKINKLRKYPESLE